MADKLNEFAKAFGKGGGGAPKGLGTGVKLLAAAAASVYGLSQSVYTGKKLVTSFSKIISFRHCKMFCLIELVVESERN